MKQFGHQRPVRSVAGEIVSMIDSPARARTRQPFNAPTQRDSRHIVVSLEAGDLIVLRLSGTRKVWRISANDLLWILMRLEANRVTLERARERKAKKAERLASERQARAERKLFGNGGAQ